MHSRESIQIRAGVHADDPESPFTEFRESVNALLEAHSDDPWISFTYSAIVIKT